MFCVYLTPFSTAMVVILFLLFYSKLEYYFSILYKFDDNLTFANYTIEASDSRENLKQNIDKNNLLFRDRYIISEYKRIQVIYLLELLLHLNSNIF